MNPNNEKQLLLVAVKGTQHQIVFGPATPSAIGGKRKQLEASGNWTGWQLQMRTQEGYKKHPIIGKPLTFEQKLKRLKP